jgi:hypothetical protein
MKRVPADEFARHAAEYLIRQLDCGLQGADKRTG